MSVRKKIKVQKENVMLVSCHSEHFAHFPFLDDPDNNDKHSKHSVEHGTPVSTPRAQHLSAKNSKSARWSGCASVVSSLDAYVFLGNKHILIHTFNGQGW